MKRFHPTLEEIEPRLVPTVLTVITPGFQGNGQFPPWAYSMGLAVNAHSPNPVSTDAVMNSRLAYNSAPGAWPANGDPNLLLYDWAAVSGLGHPDNADSANGPGDPANNVAGELASVIEARLASLPSGERLDIHFLGHSRGAYVNHAVINLLSQGNLSHIGFVQMTTLDPHPYNAGLGSDGTMDVPSLVDFADNYYETTAHAGPVSVAGAPVHGALNFNLTQVLQQWKQPNDGGIALHVAVHDWYQWTIDPSAGLANPYQGVSPVSPSDRDTIYNSTVIGKLSNTALSGDGVPNDFARGARTGYYFSLEGGGIGNVVDTSDGSLYTVDLRNQIVPLYLGQTDQQMYDVAYSPSGWLYGIDGTSKLYHITVRFDAQNHGLASTDLIGSLGVFANALQFRGNTLYAAGDSALYTVDTQSGAVTQVATLPEGDVSAGDLEFDSAGNALLTLDNGQLLRLDPSLGNPGIVGAAGANDVYGLIYGSDGVLYGFHDNMLQPIQQPFVGQAAAILPDDKQIYGAARLADASMGSFPTMSDTIGTFDPTTGTWYLRDENSPGGPDGGKFAYGGAGWDPVNGDWTGDGTTTIGVVNPATATWYLRNSNSPGAPDVTPFAYGAPGWIPLAGDWNGDGKTTVGMFDPSTATWYLRNSNTPGAPDITAFRYGAPGWIPVVGDWTGSGHTGIGAFDPATGRWYLRNEDGPGSPDAGTFAYGGAGWTPVTGDWNGDGTTSIGALNPATGTWYLRNENGPGGPDAGTFAYGGAGWIPLAGDWHGSGTLALRAAGLAQPDSGIASLGLDQLAATVAAARTRLGSADTGPAADAVLNGVQLRIADLPGNLLGLADRQNDTIWIDATAAGYGWFVDPTPLQDEEFSAGPGGVLQARAGSAASGHVDLLTTVLHEMGHLLGSADHDPNGNPGDVMDAVLGPGIRRLA
jgi:hypothetical protein